MVDLAFLQSPRYSVLPPCGRAWDQMNSDTFIIRTSSVMVSPERTMNRHVELRRENDLSFRPKEDCRHLDFNFLLLETS